MLKIGASTKNIATLRWLFSALALIPGGCVADIFGERAVSYNQEAATNKDKTILTNIIRASRGRPLQFTDLTTVSGTASQSLSIAGVFPFVVRRPPTVGFSDTVSPSASLSGGPTFSVANLSTKEFYSGILNSISSQIIGDYLIGEGYSPQVLLPLVISGIKYESKGTSITIPNDLSPDGLATLNLLLYDGLTARRVDKPMAEGPILSEYDARDPKLLASLASGSAAGNATLDLKRYAVPSTFAAAKDPNLSSKEYRELVSKGDSIYFRLEKKNTSYEFCFDEKLLKHVVQALSLPYQFPLPLQLPTNPVSHVSIDESSVCDNKLHSEPGVDSNGPAGKFSFPVRSVAEIFNFLGKIVRFNQALKVTKAPNVAEKIVVFEATEETPSGPSISATVDGHTYYISVDITGKNMSSRVLELLAELIALNSSAKDLPAPNVITVISP
jgi:hypothetical protein